LNRLAEIKGIQPFKAFVVQPCRQLVGAFEQHRIYFTMGALTAAIKIFSAIGATHIALL
jgi:hypothetical protein